jgi:HlyD family secretion protein
MKLRTKIAAAALATAAVVVAAVRPFAGEEAVTSYRTQRVISNQLRIAVTATGTLNPVRLISVGTQISGTIQEIGADWNDEVTAGQLLVKLDDRLYQAKVQMTEANLASSESQLELARIRHARQERLFAAGSAPREELDTAAANLAMAEASVAQHRAQLAQDRYNLENTSIVSPVDGVVINRAVDVGQTVAASFQTPTLIDIAQDLTKMQINASFSEADIGRLRPGLRATFTVDAYPGLSFAGVLRQIRLNPTVTSNVVTYDVVVDVDNPDLRLLPGMTAYVDIELYREDDAILVPNAALSFRPGGAGALPRQVANAGGNANGGTNGNGGAVDGNGGGGSEGRDDAGGALGTLVIPSRDDPPGNGRVWILDREGKPAPVDIQTGATDLRYTVVRGGALRPGDMVVTGESSAAGAAQGTLFSAAAGSGRGGGGGARPPRPFLRAGAGPRSPDGRGNAGGNGTPAQGKGGTRSGPGRPGGPGRAPGTWPASTRASTAEARRQPASAGRQGGRLMGKTLAETEGLRKSYVTGAGAVEVLHGVDFRLEEGEFAAVMGPSGSGKSTFMNILGCLDTSTSGVYRLLGEPVSSLSPNQLAGRRNRFLGFVFQGYNLLPKSSLLENVSLPLLYARVPSAERRRRALEQLEKVGLGPYAHRLPGQVSGGQQQRAAIARALVGRPSLILADEPTGNLDSQTSDEIMALFIELNDEGSSVVLVTHEPDVAACAKRVVRFRDGLLVEDSPVAERRSL